MNAEECTQGCCGVSRRRNVSDYFDRGLRRNRLEPYKIAGKLLRDESGLEARFSLKVENGLIEGVRFKVTSCVALTAYAELLAEEAEKLSPASAFSISPQTLIETLEGVPVFRRDRATLAVAALRSAISDAILQQSGESNESRLHIRHTTA
jgi:NifU-like protein involved in Fe-S cluster formation